MAGNHPIGITRVMVDSNDRYTDVDITISKRYDDVTLIKAPVPADMPAEFRAALRAWLGND